MNIESIALVIGLIILFAVGYIAVDLLIPGRRIKKHGTKRKKKIR